MRNVYTVKQVNLYIKNMFAQDFMLNRIYVKGEVSNCKYHTSGHIYFSLKDEKCEIRAVMFASYARKLNFKPEHGFTAKAWQPPPTARGACHGFIGKTWTVFAKHTR